MEQIGNNDEKSQTDTGIPEWQGGMAVVVPRGEIDREPGHSEIIQIRRPTRFAEYHEPMATGTV